MLANVKIEQDKENPNIHKVFVDGKQLEKIIHLDFEVNPLEIPCKVEYRTDKRS